MNIRGHVICTQIIPLYKLYGKMDSSNLLIVFDVPMKVNTHTLANTHTEYTEAEAKNHFGTEEL